MSEADTSATGAEASVVGEPHEDRGRVYWAVRNIMRHIGAWMGRHKKLCTILLLAILVIAFVERPYYQPYMLWVRIHLVAILFGVVLAAVFWLLARRRRWYTRALYGVAFAGILYGVFVWSGGVYNYLTLFVRYETLETVELKQLPLTGNERIQPHSAILSVAQEKITETESALPPDFVRIGTTYRWTMGVEPAYWLSRASENVREIFNLSATTPSPDWEERAAVDFGTGEQLLFSKNAAVCTIRAFGAWRYFSYEPTDVKYMTDDTGQWIQVVSLIRWEGFFFPRPTFGGVQVIRQRAEGLLDRVAGGCGSWIPPEKVHMHAFLRGQNVVPYAVSRYIAESFRFHNGFAAPLPGYHIGDVRIPVQPGDMNEQPYALFFSDVGEQNENGIYHYFALEPYHPERQGLALSLFKPGDGTPIVYYYEHEREHLTGVSAVPPKVRESKKEYDWSASRPIESRPIIWDVNGSRQLFWMTTVVTATDNGTAGGQIAGSTPDVTIMDPNTNQVIWVNPQNPNRWRHDVIGWIGAE